MRRLDFKKKTIITTILFLSCIGWFFPSDNVGAASANKFYFSNAEFDYYIENTEKGSKMHVVENLTAVFPETNQNHGITRSIPYSNQNGRNLTAPSKSDLHFKAQRNGESEPIAESETKHGNYIFYLGKKKEYVHGEQTYTLEYDFTNVITEFKQNGTMTWKGDEAAFQELYWDTNGTGWAQNFDHLIARIHIPADLAKNLREETSCYVGRYGADSSSSYRCKTSSNHKTSFQSQNWDSTNNTNSEVVLTFETNNLKNGENLTFAIDFEPNTFYVPEPVKSKILLYLTIGFGIVILILFYFGVRRYKKVVAEKRRYKKKLFVTPQYSQPSGLTVADTERIWLNSKKSSSFVATLIELAVNHKIELIKSEKKKALGGNKTTWSVKILSEEDLTSPQKNVLSILHGGENYKEGDVFEIKKHTTTSHLQTLARNFKNYTEKRLEEKNLLIPKIDTKKQYSNVFACVVLFLTFFYAITGLAIAEEYEDMLVGGMELYKFAIFMMTVISIILFILCSKASKIHRHTTSGIDTSNEIDGLKEYIQMAEADRLKFNQSVKGAPTSAKGIVRLYEKLLPYAIIFGEEDSWMKELNKFYKENPNIDHSWYSGSDIIAINSFHNMISHTSSSIRSTTSYTSSSSSSSGSSGGGGGGFSGGGGGGGGW